MIVLIWLFSRPFTAYKFQLKFRLKVLREQVNFANLNFKGFNLRIITWHWELVQKLHILFLMIFDSIYNLPFLMYTAFPFLFCLSQSIYPFALCILTHTNFCIGRELILWSIIIQCEGTCVVLYIVFCKRIMF